MTILMILMLIVCFLIWQLTIIVTAGSIRRQWDLNENQGPTKTEMTPKSVRRGREWWFWWFWCWSSAFSTDNLQSSSPLDPYGDNETWTRFRDRLQQKWHPNQWVGVMNETTYDVDTMIYWSSNWQFPHPCHRRIHTERTSHEREAGTLVIFTCRRALEYFSLALPTLEWVCFCSPPRTLWASAAERERRFVSCAYAISRLFTSRQDFER